MSLLCSFPAEKKGNRLRWAGLSQMPGSQKKGEPVTEQLISAATFEASAEVVWRVGMEAGRRGCREQQQKREKGREGKEVQNI